MRRAFHLVHERRWHGANGHANYAVRGERQKAAAEKAETGLVSNYPQLVDIMASAGIHFDHLWSPAAKFIAESMSGGVALIDYDGDGWPAIYFTNAQSVDMALHGVKARSALYHNNHDGTFTDVTGKAGVGYAEMESDGSLRSRIAPYLFSFF